MVSPSFHVYYVIESVVFSIVAWTYLVCFSLMIRSESLFPERLGRVHKTFHYCGWCMSVTLVIHAIDPQGIFGVLPWPVLLLVKDAFSCIAYICLALWTIQLILIIAETSGRKTARIEFMGRNYIPCSMASAAVHFTVCAICDGIAISMNSTSPRAFFLLYISLSFLFAAALMIYCVFDYVRSNRGAKDGNTLEKSQDEAPEPAKGSSSGGGSWCCLKETAKLQKTSLAFVLIGLFQLHSAIRIFFQGSLSLSADQIPSDPSQVNVFVWIIPFWVGTGIGLYASWLPLNNKSSQVAPHKTTNYDGQSEDAKL